MGSLVLLHGGVYESIGGGLEPAPTPKSETLVMAQSGQMTTGNAGAIQLAIPATLLVNSLANTVDHAVNLLTPSLHTWEQELLRIAEGVVNFGGKLRLPVQGKFQAPTSRLIIDLVTSCTGVTGVLAAGHEWGDPVSGGIALDQMRGGVDVYSEVDKTVTPIVRRTDGVIRKWTQQKFIFDMISPQPGDIFNFTAEFKSWFVHETYTGSLSYVAATMTAVLLPLWVGVKG